MLVCLSIRSIGLHSTGPHSESEKKIEEVRKLPVRVIPAVILAQYYRMDFILNTGKLHTMAPYDGVLNRIRCAPTANQKTVLIRTFDCELLPENFWFHTSGWEFLKVSESDDQSYDVFPFEIQNMNFIHRNSYIQTQTLILIHWISCTEPPTPNLLHWILKSNDHSSGWLVIVMLWSAQNSWDARLVR